MTQQAIILDDHKLVPLKLAILWLELSTSLARIRNLLGALPTIPTVNARDVYLSQVFGGVVTWPLIGDARLYAFKAAYNTVNGQTLDCKTAWTQQNPRHKNWYESETSVRSCWRLKANAYLHYCLRKHLVIAYGWLNCIAHRMMLSFLI